MAHQCPVCGCKCHCNGDIDDLVLMDERSEARCTCCIGQDDVFTDEDAAEEIENNILQEARNVKN